MFNCFKYPFFAGTYIHILLVLIEIICAITLYIYMVDRRHITQRDLLKKTKRCRKDPIRCLISILLGFYRVRSFCVVTFFFLLEMFVIYIYIPASSTSHLLMLIPGKTALSAFLETLSGFHPIWAFVWFSFLWSHLGCDGPSVMCFLFEIMVRSTLHMQLTDFFATSCFSSGLFRPLFTLKC